MAGLSAGETAKKRLDPAGLYEARDHNEREQARYRDHRDQ
jgi:hypothetical protein